MLFQSRCQSKSVFQSYTFLYYCPLYTSTQYDGGYWYYFKVLWIVNSLIASIEDNYQYMKMYKLPNCILDG
jgi:hypothetical protein